MGYIRLFKNYLFKILPIKDNCLQDLSTLFNWYVYIKAFPHLLEIINDFKLHLLTNRGVTGYCIFNNI